MDLVDSGYVVIGTVPREFGGAIFCLKSDPYVPSNCMSTIDGSRIVKSATVDELKTLFLPACVTMNGMDVITYSLNESPVTARQLSEIERVLTIRYGECKKLFEDHKLVGLVVPSINIQANFLESNFIDIDVLNINVPDHFIAEFIHLVS
jgi:hypothetical protein